ncbi:hypothetical protein BXZ70DRAFT_565044 [Cristinia sonorae]|uniref:polynucleotide adenylyltransferase n=1 Tax=Cristinia sonorae TaxID=1940300 RepID=A0A8K0UFF5_9AGAR|nr:hypothetical protein BXZ70DRAFT_565044 [Cristinia sonorae]
MAAVYPQSHVPRQSSQHGQHQAVQQPPQQQQQQPQQRKLMPKQRFLAEFSQCLYDFVIQLLPTPEELAIKEDVRKLLERLIRTLEPDSRLLSFGSTANGFSLRNSDMDLCCLIDSEDRLSASDLVTMLGDLLERETKFHVKPLPFARIPIVKLSLDPSPGLPFGIACDIGFENRLALENTRLLMCYAMIDPARVRTMVLFLKVWCKRRKINSPYKGTLSSYGYVLLVIFFLVHVKNPPVLPNLQQMPPLRPMTKEESHLNGHNVWFFDDINLLRQRWQSTNTESVAELLVDFFRFYSREFPYNTSVVSIRAGILKKDSKGWLSEAERGTARERNRLCIEDPFETDFNVARCVTRDGLYTIRGELMRASRILALRPERPIVALAQLCEERKDEELLHASPSRVFPTHRLSTFPPQTPYTVGSNPMRPVPDRLSPPQVHEAPPSLAEHQNTIGLPPDQLDHMAPRRGKWTSPPPPEAPEADHSEYDGKLGEGLALATAATDVREKEKDPETSSTVSSEVITDDDDHRSDMAESVDDVRSTRSFSEDGVVYFNRHHDSRHQEHSGVPVQRAPSFVQDPSSSRGPSTFVLPPDGVVIDPRTTSRLRGRPHRLAQPLQDPYAVNPKQQQSGFYSYPPVVSPRLEHTRRSLSGPPRTAPRYSLPLPATAQAVMAAYAAKAQGLTPRNNIFYETSSLRDRLSRSMTQSGTTPTGFYVPGNYRHDHLTAQHVQERDRELQASASSSRSHSPYSPNIDAAAEMRTTSASQYSHFPSACSTPSPRDPSQHTRLHSHSHSHSTATVTTATTPPASSAALFSHRRSDSQSSSGRSGSRSPGSLQLHDVGMAAHDYPRSRSPFAIRGVCVATEYLTAVTDSE